MMNYLILCIILCCSFTAQAGTMGVKETNDKWSYVAALSFGPTWVKNNQNQTILLQPDIEKTYAANGTSSSFTTGELFLAAQKKRAYFMSQTGLVVQITGDAQFSGDIWEDADPVFNNSAYTYAVQHTYVGLKEQLVTDVLPFIQPYVNGSIGVGFNRASHFVVMPKISAQVPQPNFAPNTETVFSYLLGVGVQKTLFKQFQFGVGYEFADWGKGTLGAATGQTLNQGVSLSHIYAQQLQFTLSYSGN